MPAWVTKYAKFWTALAGAVGMAVTLGLITGSAVKWVAVGIAFLTSLGVVVIPNTQTAK